jgi:phosphatidylserine/phosphatidylglycerophosphate/cardiolipin synthase-like enzyme
MLHVFAMVAVAGCGASDADPGDNAGDSETPLAGLSYVGQHVVRRLTENGSLAALQGRTWGVSSGNFLKDGWLIDTPPPQYWGDALPTLPGFTECEAGTAYCDPDFHMWQCQKASDCSQGPCAPVESSVYLDGQAPTKMCVGHSDGFEDEFYRAVLAAESYVDISGLWQPTGRFAPALRNALRRLAAWERPVTVRILSANDFGDGPLAGWHTADLLEQLTQGLPAQSKLTIYVAKQSAAFTSWDHAKIVAIDGKYALVGGHNLKTEDYLLQDPVFDVSMRLSGPAAIDAQRYLDELWDTACDDGWATGLVTYPKQIGRCPPPFAVPTKSLPGGAPVISVGRLGAVPDNPSDVALLAMVESAKKTILLSQQDLLPGKIAGVAVADQPKPLFERLGAAMARGVDVYLMMTTTDHGFFGWHYSNDWTPEQTAGAIRDYLATRPDLFASGTDLVGLLCQKLHVATLRAYAQPKWPDGAVFLNHAKIVIIDDKAFYAGSQNLYVSDLAEFGFIIDSADRTKSLVSSYWTPLWNWSKLGAVSGSEAAVCALRQ